VAGREPPRASTSGDTWPDGSGGGETTVDGGTGARVRIPPSAGLNSDDRAERGVSRALGGGIASLTGDGPAARWAPAGSGASGDIVNIAAAVAAETTPGVDGVAAKAAMGERLPTGRLGEG